MPQSEFDAWREFYDKYPFDDFHRFHRPAAMVATVVRNDRKLQERLDYLQPDRSNDGLTDADMTTLQTLGFKRRGG
jgi:hypothetical protein